jgi:hypothetical protein
LLELSRIVIAAPVVLPVVVSRAKGYLAVPGDVLSAVSQMTVYDGAKSEEDLLDQMGIDNENSSRDRIK